MTADEADRVALLIAKTWRGGLSVDVWTEALAGLEEPIAREAYLELRDTHDRVPSVAAFMAMYRGKRAATKAPDEPPPHCELCDGTGWLRCTDERRHARYCATPDDCHCHAVVPCSCSTGERMRPVHASILEHNRRAS